MARRLYELLLRLYPARYGRSFGSEMMDVFGRMAADARACGSWAFLRFVMAESCGLVQSAMVEWIRTLAGSQRGSVADRSLAVSRQNEPAEIIAAEARVMGIVNRMVHAIAHHDFETARVCWAEERQAIDRLRLLRGRYGLEGS